MKAAKLVSLILVILLGVVIVSALIDNPIVANDNSDGVEKITSENIMEGSLFEVLGDISIKAPFRAYGHELTGSYGESEITKDKLFYLEGEEVDQKGMLTGDEIYVGVENFIKNNTDKTIDVDLEEFYLVLSDDAGNITRGSKMPRYACLTKTSDDVKLDKFKLTMKPFAETSVYIIFVEKHSNVHVRNSLLPSICNYRVKCNDDVGFYNVGCSLCDFVN